MRVESSLAECLAFGAQALKQNPDVNQPQFEAQSLLCHVSGWSREDVLADPSRDISKDLYARYEIVIHQRLNGKPLAYITHTREFYKHLFYVDKRVLVPRPETELVVEETIRRLPQNEALKIVDVGTGSGCIAVSLKAERPDWLVTATDSSADALTVARRNAKEHKCEVDFIETNLLESFPESPEWDAVISNPPYLSSKDPFAVQDSVRKFEPWQALFAGEKGSEVIEALLAQAAPRLKTGGWVILEIGPDLKDSVTGLLSEFGFSVEGVVKDLAGWDRVVVGRKT